MNRKQKKQLRKKLKRQLSDKFFDKEMKETNYWNDKLWSFLITDY